MPKFYNIALAGPTNGGKSGILLRANEDKFEDNLHSTVGYDIVSLTHEKLSSELLTPEENKEELKIYDCGGAFQDSVKNTHYYQSKHALGLVVDLHNWGTADDEQLNQDKTQLIELISTFDDQSKKRFIYLIGTQQDKAIIAGDQVLHRGYKRFLQFANENADKIASTNVIITSAKQIDSSKIEEHYGITPAILSPLELFKKIQQDLKKAGIPHEYSKPQKKSHYAHHHSDNSSPSLARELTRIIFGFLIGLISRIIGFFVGAALGAFLGLIIHNPVTCVLAAARVPDWAEWGLVNIFRVYFFAPIINPLIAAFYGLQDGAIFGGNNGVTELLQIPKNMAEPFKLRTIITGTCLSLLIGVAIVAMVLPIIHIALPILIGVAAAGALVAAASYESFDFFKTNSELQQSLQKKKLQKQSRAEIEFAPGSLVKIIDFPSEKTLASKQNKHVFMQVNDYEKQNKAGSLLSWFQLPFKPTVSSAQARGSSYEVIKPEW